MINENKKTFVNLLRSTGREGVENVISGLDSLGFFTAGASRDHHNNFEGGLLKHSLDVYGCAIKLVEERSQYSFLDIDSIILVTLLHDVCKADIYHSVNGYIQPEYSAFPIGHGEKSVIRLLLMGLQLTEEEMLAIRWHMGDRFLKDSTGCYLGQEAKCYRYAADRYLCRLLREADRRASYNQNIIHVR